MFCNNRLKSLRTKQKVSQTAVAEHVPPTIVGKKENIYQIKKI